MMDHLDDRIAAALRERQFFQALGLATAALREQGESFDALARLARIETALGFSRRARRSWTRALSHRKEAAAYVGLGTALFREGDTAQARRMYDNALALDPAHAPAFASLGALHLYEGDLAAARRCATRAIKLEPGNLEAVLCRARAELGLGNTDLARADLATLTRARYRGAEVGLLQVDLLARDGEFEAALCLAAELCETFPSSRECLVTFRRTFHGFAGAAEPDRLAAFLDGLAHVPALADAQARPARPNPRPVGVDVIIPVQNAADHATACIRSVLDCGTACLERLIVVDDASEPETVAALQAVARRDARIVLIRNPVRRGFSAALMAGIAESRASRFVALNSDTLVSPGWLEALGGAFDADPAMVMAGPLSNNAAWQNCGEVFGADWAYKASPIPPEDLREDLIACAPEASPTPLIDLPMLHGFCVMVHRGAFDAAGGLDLTAFPEGYGEFQDLSLRLRAQGGALRVCADCLVFHAKGASLSGRRRASLSLAAREALYDRYSALNYLCLEMICAEDATLGKARRAYAEVRLRWPGVPS